MMSPNECTATSVSPVGDNTDPRTVASRKPMLAAMIVGALILAATVVLGPSLWTFFSNGEAVRTWVDAWGVLAPAAMAALVVAQIVIAILPGEPIELAAGYLFGFFEGTVICLIGGLIGTLGVTALVKAFGMRAARTFFSQEKLEGISWLRDSKRFELTMLIVFLIPGTPKDVLTYAAGLTACPWWRIAAIGTVGRIPSIVTSTLAAGFASEGSWTAAGITLIATGIIVAGGAVAYRALSQRAAR